jgi:hypothetical protein
MLPMLLPAHRLLLMQLFRPLIVLTPLLVKQRLLLRALSQLLMKQKLLLTRLFRALPQVKA